MQKIRLFGVLALLAVGCNSKNDQTLTHVQLVDRNGMNETISHKERLETLSKVDFLESQPYEKVTRVFKRASDGKLVSKLTTYHKNGELHQYLEVVGGRARGTYKEWHDNGALRIEVTVLEGIGDLTPDAQITWVFDGISKVWDREGNLVAEMTYAKGKLDGESLYYYPSGRLSKTIPYKNDKVEGEVHYYDDAGALVGGACYACGVREGRSYRVGEEEIYEKGKLMTGSYPIGGIADGRGVKPFYEEGSLRVEQEYAQGKPEGVIKLYRKNGDLETTYRIIDGQKHGEEWIYYEGGAPKLCAEWQFDELTGSVRTWYRNGKLQSEKGMVANKKQGQYLAWYEDGHLMMIEEYEKDLLVSGKYLKRGEELPVSRVFQGSGIATLFDAKGNLTRKVEYSKGEPSE